MIAKVQPSKQKSRSSFKRLLNYLTKEVDPETGETLLRGEAVLSNNLAGIDTAAAEMNELVPVVRTVFAFSLSGSSCFCS